MPLLLVLLSVSVVLCVYGTTSDNATPSLTTSDPILGDLQFTKVIDWESGYSDDEKVSPIPTNRELHSIAEINRILSITEPFDVLELKESTCSVSDINSAYRRMARLVHPDHNHLRIDSSKLAFQRLGAAAALAKSLIRKRNNEFEDNDDLFPTELFGVCRFTQVKGVYELDIVSDRSPGDDDDIKSTLEGCFFESTKLPLVLRVIRLDNIGLRDNEIPSFEAVGSTILILYDIFFTQDSIVSRSMDGNQLKNIPRQSFGSLVQLRQLSLANNPSLDLSSNLSIFGRNLHRSRRFRTNVTLVTAILTTYTLRLLSYFDLCRYCYNKLTVVPTSPEELSSHSKGTLLFSLDLSNNHFESSFVSLENLRFVKNLKLGHNLLTEIPDLSYAPYIRQLDLSYNSISRHSDVPPIPTVLNTIDLTGTSLADSRKMRLFRIFWEANKPWDSHRINVKGV